MGREDAGLAKIEHIVVLMLENRSFDQMAGRLYAPENPPPFDRVPRDQPFEGVAGRDLSNPIPPWAPEAGRGAVPVGRAADPATPGQDPGEGYAHTNLQLYGVERPPGRRCPPFPPPYNLPPRLPERAPMSGFVRDYVGRLLCDGLPAGYDDYKQIMAGFTPADLPVLSTLARAYAICDQWHCSVPSQTLSNRSFSLAGTSSGLVDNTPYLQWLGNDAPTVCNRIEEAGRPDLTWRVYYDAADVLPLTWLLLPRLRPYLFSRFAHMERFWQDCRDGRLPSFALVEPRLYVDRNDQHPPASVLPGEQLIADVYRAVRQSPNWESTLLIVTYDEHGGCYDHVPPPAAVPPDPAAPAGQFGFRFDRLGVRVPTLLISPWIEPGTVFRARDAAGRCVPLEHTAIIKTVTARFGLPGLTARDAASPDLGAVLTRRTPRTDTPLLAPTAPTPATTPPEQPPCPLLAAAIHLGACRLAQPVPAGAQASTGDALDFLRRVRRRLTHSRRG